MWLISKAGALTVAAYLVLLQLSGMAVNRLVTDPVAFPIWGAFLSLPGSVIVGTPGHIYYAVTFNIVLLYLAVAFWSSQRRKKSR